MIRLSLPLMTGKENKYVQRAFDGNWIVPLGPEVDEFEHKIEQYLGCEPGTVVALSAGTAALHLAMVMAEVKRDDIVICQSMTFAASCFPILYQAATPIFVDSEPETWNISPELLKQAILSCPVKPKAIVAVDLYGMPAKWDEIRQIARKYEIPLIEDSAEALGSEYKGVKCGKMGDYGVLSFNGNKIITTSGGGALICPTREDAARVKFLSTQARENRPYYYHETVGYNYRMSNVGAAIGCGQIEDLTHRVERRHEVHQLYFDELNDFKGIKVHVNPSEDYDSNFWLTTILLPNEIEPEKVRQALMDADIETRLIWRPMHMQPVFAGAKAITDGVSEAIFNHGLCLPSSITMSNDDLLLVTQKLKSLL